MFFIFLAFSGLGNIQQGENKGSGSWCWERGRQPLSCGGQDVGVLWEGGPFIARPRSSLYQPPENPRVASGPKREGMKCGYSGQECRKRMVFGQSWSHPPVFWICSWAAVGSQQSSVFQTWRTQHWRLSPPCWDTPRVHWEKLVNSCPDDLQGNSGLY